jgi:NadR type nicotinamide-nucleotide adenylyltransferase
MVDGRDGERDGSVKGWAGGGGSWEPDPPKKDPPPPTPRPKTPTNPQPKKPEDPKRARTPSGVQNGSTGVVCGRFLPVHRGHQYLLDVARAQVDQLLIIVFATPTDPIPGSLRVRWLREMYPDCDVKLEERTESSLVAPDPAELARAITRHRPRAPHYFFASELSYQAAATALGSMFVPVDPTRAIVPISGTAMRAELMRNFEMLPAIVRPWLVRRVAVIGAESTGKTTLCQALATAYKTVHVPEYARTLSTARGGGLGADDLQLAANGQIAAEDALAKHAKCVLFCDTEARTLAHWADRITGSTPKWIGEKADARPYDLLLLTPISVPFVGMPERDRPEERKAFHSLLRRDAMLAGHVVELEGDRAAVLAQAKAAVDEMLDVRGLLSARGSKMV